MGSVYRRAETRFWWLKFTDAHGKKRLESSGTENEAEARQLLAEIEAMVKAEKELAKRSPGRAGPLTFRDYSDLWLKDREALGTVTRDNRKWLKYAFEAFGDAPLAQLRREHVKELIAALMRQKDGLAPRSIRHVYFTVRLVFRDAQLAGLVVSSPCTLRQDLKELPKKKDKNPLWRRSAVFSRPELEQLISDTRVEWFRRVRYGLLFLTGMRAGEVAVRRWHDYDATMEPLGRLAVVTSWSRADRLEKEGTKTGIVREVPVHPTLAKMLAEWRLRGWAEYMGQRPTESDLILPAPSGRVSESRWLKRLHEDLATLGLRVRRQHDARRTFISLARADGAADVFLKHITHGAPESEILDVYTTPRWEDLCRAVSCLRIRLREGTLLPLPLAAAGTAWLQVTQTAETTASLQRGVGDLKPIPLAPDELWRANWSPNSTPYVGERSTLAPDAPKDCSPVADPVVRPCKGTNDDGNE